MSLDAYAAAKVLNASGHLRSSISRCYYAAYSAAVAQLIDVKGLRFKQPGNNPSHEKLPDLILTNLDEREFPLWMRRHHRSEVVHCANRC